MYVKHDMFVFVIEKAKQKLFFENCKCFKKKKILLRAYFCWRIYPPYDCGSGFISVNFDNFYDQWLSFVVYHLRRI